MFSILSVFGTVKALLTLAAVGAGAGAISWGAARLIGGFGGLIAACVLGAAVVIGSGGAGYMTATSNCADKARLNQLALEKELIERELRVEREAAAIQDEVVAEQQRVLDYNQAALDKLDAIIAKSENNDFVCVTAEELEAIDDLR